MRAARRLLAWFALPLCAACGDFGDGPATPRGTDDPEDPPPATASFSVSIQPIFDAHCIGCHGAGGNAGLDLRAGASRAHLVGVTASESPLARVEPGEPDASWLYLKLTDQQNVGSAMPPGDPLSPDLTESVRTWIEEGALDN